MDKLKHDVPTFNSEEEISNQSYIRRRIATGIVNFIDELPSQVCDLGPPNYKKSLLEEKLDISIQSIYGFDFDLEPIPVKCGTLFCFEILEHLFNPLFFLNNCRESLIQNGVLYLSTPYRPHFLWTEHHYHEIDDRRIEWLFEKANLEVIKHQKMLLYRGIKFHLSGIRPFLRLFTHTRLFKLKSSLINSSDFKDG